MTRLLIPLTIVVALASASPAAMIEPKPYRTEARIPDVAEVLSPSHIRIDGWIGPRISANEAKRLLAVDTTPLLAGFKKKPGTHPWIGEHIGKWLHAATLAWAYTGDPALRRKIDGAVAELVAAQEPDGYLGTYVPGERFGLYRDADWDVWSHKYNLIGLLTYYQYTGNGPALNACRKIGDLLIATFPAKRSILGAGTHMGMAATSVLEPVVLLYRFTGDERYLGFARYIVRSWDEPRGPRILATLLKEKAVNKTANGKAYEMLSNLVGVCELARASGDRSLLEPVVNAWNDVVSNRLYLTGSASAGEIFQPDHSLPNSPGANICETCVTTTWIQLNLQLLRLTGEARYASELERTTYNHLAAAQHPRGDDWCYYTALEGTKPYDPGINCCHSSGPRGMALVPQTAYLIRKDENGGSIVVVNTLETSRVVLDADGATVLEQKSEFPRAGRSVLTIRTTKPSAFAVHVRVPTWATPLRVRSGNLNVAIHPSDWAVVPARTWHDGDTIELGFTLAGRRILGDHTNANLAALAWGPFALACDERRNPGLPPLSRLGLVDEFPPLTLLDTRQPLAFSAHVVGGKEPSPRVATFVTFADAGSDGGRYRVWLRAPGVAASSNESLFSDGRESRSRHGNQSGSINDGDFSSFAVTFDGHPAAEDWFSITLDAPVEIGRVAFVQGTTFHDGGWFDTSTEKVHVEYRNRVNGPWLRLGVLSAYPATTAEDRGPVRAGAIYTLVLDRPVRAVAMRVIGKPASGDNPAQAFASCAELQGFAR